MKLNVLLVALFFFNGCSSGHLNSNTIDLNRLIQNEINKKNIPALSYAIIKEDEIVASKSFGLSEYTNKMVSDENAIYLLASISKTITAVAIMQIYEDKKIDLDADINNYLPFSLKNPYYPNIPITTRMLLTHTSGLAWPTNSEDPNFSTPLEEIKITALTTWVENYLSPNGEIYKPSSWKKFPPGEHYQYSNIGGALLGLIVESVTGTDFNAYCKQYIFQPLEMFNTGFRLKDVNLNHLVTPVHDGRIMSQYSVAHYPASMLKSSIKELSNFLIAIINKGVFKNIRILNSNTVDDMLSIQIRSEKQAYIWQKHSSSWVGHVGGYWGVSSSMDLNQSNKIGVIILTNVYGVDSVYPKGIIYKMIHKAAKKYF